MKRRILVVEDDVDLVEVIRCILEKTGYDVTCATTSEEALRRARAARFDMVILDLILPDCDGLILQGKLRKLSPDLTSRTIFMTGFSTEEPVALYLKSVSVELIHKPFSASELLEAVSRVA